ncbi:hypothetical protein [Pseudohongiella spirulinae]|uniref:Uncharacterized protein n=1 Tax=Pseudohongiella spirulinae TaxID=1249552 RepID=A0A0S2KBT8_9GAMM|nr:hypothetical protein [Pseudohongiella spirulinae]ALO45394.1 hypothetical protein PS2015_716 [Pseudohongiella spirulinae]
MTSALHPQCLSDAEAICKKHGARLTSKRVDETGAREDILLQLNQEVHKSGFTMQQEQLEIHGTCHRCAKKSRLADKYNVTYPGSKNGLAG